MKTPLVGYYGGKSRMREALLDILAPAEWERYVEPFCGGAAVFFGAWSRWGDRRTYILNDKMDCIVNFYRQIKVRPDELIAFAEERLLYSHSLHQRSGEVLRAPPGDKYSDLERAWAVWYNIATSFSNIMLDAFRRPTSSPSKSAPKELSERLNYLADSATALQKCVIEQSDAVDIIQRYDRRGVCFFIDPPYVGARQRVYPGYFQKEFDILLATMLRMEGDFVMTTYENEALSLATAAAGWRRIEYETTCPIAAANYSGREGDGDRKEIITTNIPAAKVLI